MAILLKPTSLIQTGLLIKLKPEIILFLQRLFLGVDYCIRGVSHTDLLQANGNVKGAKSVTIRGNEFYDTNGQLLWLQPFNNYEVDDFISHNGLDYKCIQKHDSRITSREPV